MNIFRRIGWRLLGLDRAFEMIARDIRAVMDKQIPDYTPSESEAEFTRHYLGLSDTERLALELNSRRRKPVDPTVAAKIFDHSSNVIKETKS